MARVWTQEEIKNLLATNSKMVEHSVVVLFERQTLDEQESHESKELNGVGFNKLDSGILSSFAKAYVEYGRLSSKQIAVARKKLMKYSRQLTLIANGVI